MAKPIFFIGGPGDGNLEMVPDEAGPIYILLEKGILSKRKLEFMPSIPTLTLIEHLYILTKKDLYNADTSRIENVAEYIGITLSTSGTITKKPWPDDEN